MDTTTIDVMTPTHPRWGEFIQRLEGPEGCNFHEQEDGRIGWDCVGSTDHPYSIRILTAMGFSPESIAASRDYFRQHGGYCDCEILFNVEASAGYGDE